MSAMVERAYAPERRPVTRRVAAPPPRSTGTRRTSAERAARGAGAGTDGRSRRTPTRHPSAPSPAASRPELRIVPKPRAAANAAIVLFTVVVVLMLAAVVLHTRIAERQLEIDRLESSVTAARERFDVLRQQRAELRSPTRLALESASLGMGVAPRTEFLAVDAQTLAEMIAAAGAVDETTGEIVAPDPLEQIRRVKAATAGALDAGQP